MIIPRRNRNTDKTHYIIAHQSGSQFVTRTSYAHHYTRLYSTQQIFNF